jgi:hypothetical protein
MSSANATAVRVRYPVNSQRSAIAYAEKDDMLRGMRVSSLAVIVLSACASGTGNPSLDEFPHGATGGAEVTYHDIKGSTAQQLVAEMRRLGPEGDGISARRSLLSGGRGGRGATA